MGGEAAPHLSIPSTGDRTFLVEQPSESCLIVYIAIDSEWGPNGGLTEPIRLVDESQNIGVAL